MICCWTFRIWTWSEVERSNWIMAELFFPFWIYIFLSSQLSGSWLWSINETKIVDWIFLVNYFHWKGESLLKVLTFLCWGSEIHPKHPRPEYHDVFAIEVNALQQGTYLDYKDESIVQCLNWFHLCLKQLIFWFNSV